MISKSETKKLELKALKLRQDTLMMFHHLPQTLKEMNLLMQ